MKTINPINKQFCKYNICFYVVSTDVVNSKKNIMKKKSQVYIGYGGDSIDPILSLEDEDGESELILPKDIREEFNCNNFNIKLKDLEHSRLEFTPLNYKGTKTVRDKGTDFKNKDLVEVLNKVYENKNIGDF